MGTWGHKIEDMSPKEMRVERSNCSAGNRCRGARVAWVSYVSYSKLPSGRSSLPRRRRLAYCDKHARAFAEKHRLDY